ncbi:MAG TPA: helix-turn-helix domain-containing protein [Candidatus Dormibacteraeota bacterium]|nr:helix-turn-helix domain-containing protein [Candidatus Dormibacteraeota bacterium]
MGGQRRGTRERLIEAAAELIAEDGYDRAGVQAIARRAELTNGAIYANFRDKADLLAAAIEVKLDHLIGAIDEGRRAGDPSVRILELLGRKLALETPERDRELLVEAWAAARRDPEVGVLVRGAHARAEAAVAGVVEQAKADDDVAPDVDAGAVARFGTALSIGYHVLHTAGMPDPDDDAWVRLMTRVVASISTREPAAPPVPPG